MTTRLSTVLPAVQLSFPWPTALRCSRLSSGRSIRPNFCTGLMWGSYSWFYWWQGRVFGWNLRKSGRLSLVRFTLQRQSKAHGQLMAFWWANLWCKKISIWQATNNLLIKTFTIKQRFNCQKLLPFTSTCSTKFYQFNCSNFPNLNKKTHHFWAIFSCQFKKTKPCHSAQVWTNCKWLSSWWDNKILPKRKWT